MMADIEAASSTSVLALRARRRAAPGMASPTQTITSAMLELRLNALSGWSRPVSIQSLRSP